MSQDNPDDAFWNVVDQFISSANESAATQDIGLVASAMLNASARFSAFYVAGSSESRADLKEDKDVLIADISREFKKRFAEELEDYIENYKVYLRANDKENQE